VEIVQVRPSCGCTTADVPRAPWVLAPGERGSFRATVDFTGKQGKLFKAIYVNSAAGTQVLHVVVNIPESDPAERKRNQELAMANRQRVFSGDCAACHRDPIGPKTGAELFQTACGICHLAPQRAAMVADLLTAREPRDAAWWRRWISDGKDGTLMPAFAQKNGGPLTDQQIDSLVEFALSTLPTQPRKD
jgi:mono/diheme cytochrome c family protein